MQAFIISHFGEISGGLCVLLAIIAEPELDVATFLRMELDRPI